MPEHAIVGLIMGSKTDWETLQHCGAMLDQLKIPYEARVLSAHRTPDLLFEYISSAESRGLEVISPAPAVQPIWRELRRRKHCSPCSVFRWNLNHCMGWIHSFRWCRCPRGFLSEHLQ